MMVGAAFAIDRKYFGELGGYDTGMKVWGGENLEMAWRVRTRGRDGVGVMADISPSFRPQGRNRYIMPPLPPIRLFFFFLFFFLSLLSPTGAKQVTPILLLLSAFGVKQTRHTLFCLYFFVVVALFLYIAERWGG